jgi:hypothetical protein
LTASSGIGGSLTVPLVLFLVSHVNFMKINVPLALMVDTFLRKINATSVRHFGKVI